MARHAETTHVERAPSHQPLPSELAPARLGALLRDARRRASLTGRAAARKAGIRGRELRDIEAGSTPPDSELLDSLAKLYGTRPSDLVPPRIPITISPERISAAGHSVRLADDAEDALLAGFVNLIRGLRGSGPGDALAVRAADLEALARAVGTETDDIEGRIADIVGCSRDDARRLKHELLRRRLLVPAAGLALGAAAVTGIAVGTGNGAGGGAPVANAPDSTSATANYESLWGPVSHEPPSAMVQVSAVPAETLPAAEIDAPHVAEPAIPEPQHEPDPQPDVFVPPGEEFVEFAAADAAPDTASEHSKPDVFLLPGEEFIEYRPQG